MIIKPTGTSYGINIKRDIWSEYIMINDPKGIEKNKIVFTLFPTIILVI